MNIAYVQLSCTCSLSPLQKTAHANGTPHVRSYCMRVFTFRELPRNISKISKVRVRQTSTSMAFDNLKETHLINL